MTGSQVRGTQVPRGTRLSRSARRAQLLQAAQEVFVERGYHASGMDEIADRARVSKPVLYQHFPGKFDLYLALLDRADEEMLATVSAALGPSRSNRERVAATVAAYFEFVVREGEAYRLIFESDLSNEPRVRERLNEVHTHCADVIAPLIRQDTDLDTEQSHLLAGAVVGMAQVSARTWLREGRRVPVTEAVRLVTHLAWRGMRGFPGAEGDAAPARRPAAADGPPEPRD